MSDIEISGSDSEPVSDVNPEDMAKLMADLDDMDNDLFKSTLKSTTAKKDEDSKRQVKFNEKPSSAPKNKAKAHKDDDDDEDWDADDLLQSDDETQKKKPQKVPPSTRTSSSPVKAKSPSQRPKGNEDDNTKLNVKSKLMEDLFSDETTNTTKDPGKNMSSPGEESKKDKSKLMADLFGNNDASGDSKTKKSPIKKNPPPGKKAKEDITFDDDDDLLGGIGESKTKNSAATNSPMSGGFLDNLLAKSSTADKVTKEKSPEFILDDKYKNMNKGKNEGKGFGGYMPSSGKSESPPQRTPKKTGLDDPFDFLSDAEPRRRNPRSSMQRKTFEIDDDDILGNVRSHRGRNKEQEKQNKQSPETSTKGEAASAKSKNDSWLFGSPSNTDKTLKETIHETSVQASVEHENISKAQTPNKSQDWLGDLLSSSKKSPQKYQQGLPVGGSPTYQPSGPSPQVTSSAISAKMPNSKLPTGVDDASKTSNTNSDIHSISALKAAEDTQREFLKNQQMAEAQTAVAVEQMKIQQEHLLQQQEAKLKAAAMAASQMKLQQDQLEAQLSQQLLHQQQEMAKYQDAAIRRYQDMMVGAPMSQLNIGNSSNEKNTQDEKIKELEIQLRSAEIEVARLEAELELLRKQHSEEVTILEESHRKKHLMEKDVWERTEQRLKEERNSLVSDFQAKVSALQAERESLGASYEAQLANVKREWTQAVDRTKELYSEMTERMKTEHSSALERMTYLKNLELNAVVSASGHVKEVEAVMSQLESNTTNLSNLTASINTRHDSALELTQKALKLKEKQLKDFEAVLEASRAEAESERGRLNSLVTRLESTLIQQGSEVEKERWKLAQEQMKIEIERKALHEERRHLQMSVEADRQNLTSIRESFLAEHKVLLQSVARDKQELASQRVQLSAQQKVPHMSLYGNQFSKNISEFELEAELAVINDERRRLKEKMTSINHQEQQLKEEKQNLEELNSKLEQNKAQVSLESNLLLQEKASLRKTQEEIRRAEEASEAIRKEQQSRLSQITTQTQALHVQQDRIQKEQLKLEQQHEKINSLVQMGLCPSCQNRGTIGYAIESSIQHTFGRLPGDGGEGHASSSKVESFNLTSLSPASVLARLAAARERENLEREKRLLQISALEFS